MPNRALEIIAGVLGALEFSHRHGIVHRDIKPANVMITANGAVKVMDFGIARALADSGATMTQTAAVIGTAQYLSPEQARGETVDARSDVYSTGCLLYELLTGRPPFQGDSPVAVAYQHVRENPMPPSTLNPDIGAEVDAIVLKALAKNPENRYQSAAEMRADINRALQGATVAAPPVMAEPPTQPISAITEPERGREEPQGRLLGARDRHRHRAGPAGSRGVGVARRQRQDRRRPRRGRRQASQAQQTVEDAGFVVQVETQTSDEKKNTVLTQDPAANTEAEEGSTVTLVVSAGPEQVEVPDVVGLAQQAAIEQVQAANLRVDTTPVDSDQAAGTVISTDPAGGTLVDAGSDRRPVGEHRRGRGARRRWRQ